MQVSLASIFQQFVERFFFFFLDLKELLENVQLENNLHIQTHTQITGCRYGAL